MEQVPLKVLERQEISVELEGSLYELVIKECNGIMAVKVTQDEVVLQEYRRAVAGMWVVPPLLMTKGNFIFITADDNLPYFTEFDSTTQLLYLTLDEVNQVTASSGLVVPTIISSPLVDFKTSDGALPHNLRLTRDSVATYLLPTGVVKGALKDVARFETEGMLLEGSMRNFITSSRSPTLALDYTADGDIDAPDNGIKAVVYKLGPVTTADSPFRFNSGDSGPTIGVKTASCWAISPDNACDIYIECEDRSPTYYTLQPNVWTRISTTRTEPNPSFNNFFDILQVTPTTGQRLAMWGGQLEEGLVETSYFATEGTSVNTRAQDFLSYTGKDAQWYYLETTNGRQLKPYTGPIPGDNSYGHVLRLIVWNREPTPAEKKALGV